MILLQKVILLFKLNNPVATMKEVVFLVIDDACKRLFLAVQDSSIGDLVSESDSF